MNEIRCSLRFIDCYELVVYFEFVFQTALHEEFKLIKRGSRMS